MYMYPPCTYQILVAAQKIDRQAKRAYEINWWFARASLRAKSAPTACAGQDLPERLAAGRASLNPSGTRSRATP